ncbi:MAG: hypothetical protein ACK58L_12555 [Planctomycetota bacterium]
MNWFEQLTGFRETGREIVRASLEIDGIRLRSSVNQREYQFGVLEIPSLAELREKCQLINAMRRPLTVQEVVGDVQDLHCDPMNAGGMFQVASQFNLLEMTSPNVTPEDGVSIYESDRTQGPACAIACGAGTIYRNYFIPVGDQIGQCAERQIDCLSDLGKALGNQDHHLWTMRNGYALPTRKGLNRVRMELSSADENRRDHLRSLLRIGVHRNTQVTLQDCQHVVTQAYCSAVPISYSGLEASLWEPFAQLILEAAYEATFCAAELNAAETGNPRLFLTLLGGGAFGNNEQWIVAAIRGAMERHRMSGLDVSIVSFRQPRRAIRELVERFGKSISA